MINSLALFFHLLPDVAVAHALTFEVGRIVVQANGGVAAYAKLRYSPKDSPFPELCPERVDLPSGGLPWSVFHQLASLNVAGIPDRFRSKERVVFSPSVGFETLTMREGDELSGLFNLTYFFNFVDRRTYRTMKLAGDIPNDIKIRVSSRFEFHSTVVPGKFSMVTWNVESKWIAFTIEDPQERPKKHRPHRCRRKKRHGVRYRSPLSR